MSTIPSTNCNKTYRSTSLSEASTIQAGKTGLQLLSSGKCPASALVALSRTCRGGTQDHSYDTGGSLIDEGVSYDTLGDATVLPGSDGGPIESSFYADGQVHIQSQQETQGEGKEPIKVANTYTMDPEGRTLTTTTTNEALQSATTVSHYAAPGQATPSWSFLGASGLSSTLPGGAITQDGVTYIPQTGEPLPTASRPEAALPQTYRTGPWFP